MRNISFASYNCFIIKKKSKETFCQAFYRIVEIFSNRSNEKRSGRGKISMGLQSWRNFVVIQHRDRDKLGTITSVHPPSSIDSVNLERKNIIFHPRFSSIKEEEEKGLKQVGLNVTTWRQIANTPQLQVF